MAQLYAYSAFNIDYLDLNWYLATYQSESMMPSALDGYEDAYLIYNTYDESLVMVGSGFAYDTNGAPTIGTVEAIGEAYMDADGYWWEYFWAAGLNVSMADVTAALITPSSSDELALVKQQFSGRDQIYLSAFDDTMSGYDGNDRVYGYGGGDALNGGRGNDKIFGGADNDIVNGGGGRDTVVGGNGADTVKGGGGDDIIRGGSGRDREVGGNGEDRFVFQTGDDKAFIQDFDAKGASHDVLDLSGLTSIRGWQDLTRHHIEHDGSDIRIDGGDGDVIVLRDVTLGTLDKGDFLF